MTGLKHAFHCFMLGCMGEKVAKKGKIILKFDEFLKFQLSI